MATEQDQRWATLESRCEAVGRKCEIAKIGKGGTFKIAMVHMPDGGSERPILLTAKDLEGFLELDFEKFQLVGTYHAVCSVEDGAIEGFLERAGTGAPVARLIKRVLGGEDSEEGDDDESASVELEMNGIQLRIGPPSPELQAMIGDVRAGRGPRATSIRISGVSIPNHETALNSLETVTDSLFFQFDSKFREPIVLSRSRPFWQPPGSPQKDAKLEFPKSQYDREPMSLYWYGRGAQGLPLLQFFAYYQVLEFYFDHYVEAEARRRIARTLKDPSFDAHNERHVARILRAVGQRGRSGRADERGQLITTIRGFADAQAVRGFIGAEEDRKKFFGEKQPGLTDKVIRTSASDSDLLQEVADRIYDIRCKIVHTKEGGGRDGVELLLPHSPEADRMHRDIGLLHILIRQALVAASRPLSVPDQRR